MKVHRPATVEEAKQIVRAAYENKQVLDITTAKPLRDTEASWLSTEHWQQWFQFDVDDMVLSVGSGMPLRLLYERLARHGMRLNLNGWFERDTIGSAYAAYRVGPDRTFDGGIRDAVIGIEYINATGRLVKAGGQVVKNVTGYDVMRMMLGSHGAFGVITKLNFKMMPAPVNAQTLIFAGQAQALLDHTKELNLAQVPLNWCAIRGQKDQAEMAIGIAGNGARQQRLLADLRRIIGKEVAAFAEDQAPSEWAWTAPAQRLVAGLEGFVLEEHQLHLNVRVPPGLLYEACCRNALTSADAYQIHPFSADFHLVYRNADGPEDRTIHQLNEPLAKAGGHMLFERVSDCSAWQASFCEPDPPNAALTRLLYKKLDPHSIFRKKLA